MNNSLNIMHYVDDNSLNREKTRNFSHRNCFSCSNVFVLGCNYPTIYYIVHTGVNILSRDPFGPSFQQKKIEVKSVHKQKSSYFWGFSKSIQQALGG